MVPPARVACVAVPVPLPGLAQEWLLAVLPLPGLVLMLVPEWAPVSLVVVPPALRLVALRLVVL